MSRLGQSEYTGSLMTRDVRRAQRTRSGKEVVNKQILSRTPAERTIFDRTRRDPRDVLLRNGISAARALMCVKTEYPNDGSGLPSKTDYANLAMGKFVDSVVCRSKG